MRTRRTGGPPSEGVLRRIARYICDYAPCRESDYLAARLALVDALGCALDALGEPECLKLLGPVVPGTSVPHGARVPGTPHCLDPVKAAFDISVAIRWRDYSDALLGAQPSHPSDNIGAIIAAADHLSQQRRATGRAPLSMREVLAWIIKVYEVHGAIGLANGFYDVGLDQTPLVGVASAAAVAGLMGGTSDEVMSAVSHAWLDGASLGLYRRAPNAGTRKNWAGPDAAARGVELARRALKGEQGCAGALTAPMWGFQDVLFKGQPIRLPRTLGSTVVNNVQFKVAFPTVFNAQTAAECAVRLHPQINGRVDSIGNIIIESHRTAIRLNGRDGPLRNRAERDHSLQYVIAIGLLYGRITTEMYEDGAAIDPRIAALRGKMRLRENPAFTRKYADPLQQASAAAVEVVFVDGTTTGRVAVSHPLGHPRRRREALPLIERKFAEAVGRRLPATRAAGVVRVCGNQQRLERMPVDEFMALFV